MKTLAKTLLILTLAAGVTAHDYAPGPKQSAPVLLKGGTLYTISDGILPNTDILFENGVITQLAPGIVPTKETEVIDVTGQNVYPGLIALGTSLGLIEIGAVRATDDQDEVGSINPEVQAHIAFNPDTEIIPTVRSNGIAYAQITPGGAMIRGRSCLLNLDCWTKEDGALELDLGLHLSMPSLSLRRRGDQSLEDRQKANERQLDQLREAFDDALAYKLAKEADPNLPVDTRWEAMLPVLAGEKPLFVHASDYRQIEFAVDFTKERRLKMVLYAGREAWKLADLLAANNIPVVFDDAFGLPQRADDPYDQSFRALSILYEAGVKVSIEASGASGVRNLPFGAGMAVAWGLPHEIGLRALTLSAAEILGVDDQIGSLEIGKRASIIVSNGDILDHITHKVTRMFIDGRVVNLDNKHEELYRKYRARSVEK